MLAAVEAMQVAFRVLQAIWDKQMPEPTDVERLRAYSPLLADAPLDELACDVIQQALKRRAEARGRAAGSS